MRGIKECLNWMIDNPDKELKCTNCNDLNNRRFRNGMLEFKTIFGNWEKSEYISCFMNYDWQPYDPNPAVDFHVAYMDCLENGSKYLNEDKDFCLRRAHGKVALTWVDGLRGYELNYSKWKKVE